MSDSKTYSISYGEIAFTAYREAAGGQTYDGKSIPQWSELGDHVRDYWEIAALAVLRRRQVLQVERPN